MVRSLYSGVAGLTSHQTKMDVIGNNIANVNTYGFKSSRTSFSDVYYQSVKSATGGTETFAGNNPSTIGYGVQVASIDKDMSQSSFQSTNRKLDLAISGDGFFAVGTFTSQADGSAPADKPKCSYIYKNGQLRYRQHGKSRCKQQYVRSRYKKHRCRSCCDR